MSFSGNWHTLLEAAEELSPDTTLITPLSHTQFRITDIQEHRVIIEILDSDDSQPLQRDQFETLYRRVQDASGGFELDRLPPDSEPYAAVLTLHPQFEIDEDAGILVETDAPAATQVIDEASAETDDRTEPDVSVYLQVNYSGPLFDERDRQTHERAAGWTITLFGWASAVFFPTMTVLVALNYMTWPEWLVPIALIVLVVCGVYGILLFVVRRQI